VHSRRLRHHRPKSATITHAMQRAKFFCLLDPARRFVPATKMPMKYGFLHHFIFFISPQPRVIVLTRWVFSRA
jgi:hypothetical protein